MTVQIRNAEMVDLLKADFQHRNEPNFAWRAACSMFQALPGLRGFWPMSTFDNAGNAMDLSGHATAMAYAGNPTYAGADLAPYIDMDAAGDFLWTPDAALLDILGTETYVLAAQRGITVGGWFYANALPGASAALITKYQGGVPGNQAYLLQVLAAGTAQGIITDPGGLTDTVTSTNTVGATEWFFACLRWSGTGASTTMSMYLNGTQTNQIPVRASINNSGASFCLASYHPAPAGLFNGRLSMCFLCATSLPDVTVFSLYEQTRRLYYV